MSQRDYLHAGVHPPMSRSSITNWIQRNVSGRGLVCQSRPEVIVLDRSLSTDPITPLSIEMLAGEDLPHLLQTLLVGVEHAICRIPLDELTFPSCPNVFGSIEFAATDYSMDEKNAATKRAECNLKRRELITKNNSINKKYAAKRSNGRECESIEYETVDSLTASAGQTCDEATAAAAVNEGDPGAATQPSTLPLFCLGGSFPHIDSDEESGDDGKKIQTGEFSSHCRSESPSPGEILISRPNRSPLSHS
jgi:hypothetical protein